MAERKQKIHLKVAGKAYEMSITPDKEEIYRMAESEVNASVTKLRKTFGDTVTTEDCLAITALQLCINGITIARQSQIGDEDMAALDALSQRLDKHINRIPVAKPEGAKKKTPKN